jgi:hypothetical protein
MVGMAKSKPKGRPRKHPGEPDSGGRTGVPVSVRIDPKLREAVNPFILAFYQKNKVKLDLTTTIELALTELVEKWEIPLNGHPPA